MTSLYVDIRPLYLEIAVGDAGSVSVSITNSSEAIDGYTIRVFGLDPEWVTVSPARVAVFPGETAEVRIDFTLPRQFPAGHRQITVQVVSENNPDDFSLVQMAVNVGSQPRARLRLDPTAVVGAKRATFNLVVANEGNTPIHVVPEGIDPEETATFEFHPAALDISPGRRDTIEATVVGKRPWVGGPKARVLQFAVTTPDRIEGVASFVQRPRISRWVLSLMGLIAAAAVFAAVLSRTFDSVVDEASVDPGVLDKALDQGAAGGTKIPLDAQSITGVVQSLTSGEGIAGVQADLYLASDTTAPIYTAATGADGTFAFGRLADGSYLLRFTGAGFADIWYPLSSSQAEADTVTIDGASVELEPVQIGGRPGSISGTVIADDLKGVTATLFLPGVIPPEQQAEVLKVKVGPDGAFVFENVASPNTYTLVVEKPGFADDVRELSLRPAQTISGIEVTLRRGDGAITGIIETPDGPLGGVIVEATDGTTKVTTASLTEGEPDAIGTYVLRGLPTPAVYTVTVRLAGYTSASRTITLGPEQQVPDVAFSLARATGTIRGTVSLAGVGPVGGVDVTVSGGDVKVTTTTVSQGSGIGTYVVEALPIPATYTITFTRPDLITQVRLQDMDPLEGTADVPALDVSMVYATAVVKGEVRNADTVLVGGAEIVLSDGATERTMFSAHDPAGEFEFVGVPPGTYTLTAELKGATPSVVLVNVTAAEIEDLDILLEPQASFFGLVTVWNPSNSEWDPFPEAVVRIFRVQEFPGSINMALDTQVANELGEYRFMELDAPEDFVIAVYANEFAPNPLDSKLVVTQPSEERTVDPFEIEL